MTTIRGPHDNDQAPGDYAAVQEIRLAVVMYGGVSLAIYMNGVAHELLNLVKATAPAKDTDGNPTGQLLWSEDGLTGAGRVYRRLGRILAGTAGEGTATGDSGPVRTRFVIDIVTGTSAGGINGVFLAKALSSQQEMDGLTRMWREEGDLSKLLNNGARPSTLDGRSTDALLNSRRILELFNEAIKGMEWDGSGLGRPNPLECASPYVEDLDLFVTTTDMAGLLMPLRLEDRVIFERRYRNFFHFRYGYPSDNGAPYNSFQPLNSTFLAFASRCTSAFPFAFAPMNLETAISVCGQPGLADWSGFYADYANAARATTGSATSTMARDQSVDFAHRYFIDGGCLDNKPFSYAIDALRWKQSDLPVTRKLFYVEPAPAHPETERVAATPPDALDSVYSGYVDLPRVENIREDLQRLLDRNRLIGRLQDALADVSPSSELQDTERWKKTTLFELRRERGPGAAAYAAYHRIKVSAVTDAIATTVVCAAGLDDASDDALAIRYLVKAWRNETYPDILNPLTSHPAAAREGRTSATFLLDFDIDYRIRRLGFARRAIDGLSRQYGSAGESERKALRAAKSRVNAIRRGLLRTDALGRARNPSSGNPLLPLINAIARAIPGGEASTETGSVFSALVRQILAGDSDDERLGVASRLYEQIREPVQALASGLANLYSHPPKQRDGKTGDNVRIGLFEASERAVDALTEVGRALPDSGHSGPLIDTYYGYESYDAASFPLLFGTGVGEVKVVEVVRISPDDASPLGTRRPGAPKLAGDSLGHFGAFLRQSWREHDILWGRMDGVDRIVHGLAPTMDPSLRGNLIRDGQIAVLQEWCDEIGSPLGGQSLFDLLTDPSAHIPADAAATGNGWQLTPCEFIESSRVGAARGLAGMRDRDAESFAGRSLVTLAGMSAGMAARRPVWSAIPLQLIGRLCSGSSRLLSLGPAAWIGVAIVGVGMSVGGGWARIPWLRDAGIVALLAGAGTYWLRHYLVLGVLRILR